MDNVVTRIDLIFFYIFIIVCGVGIQNFNLTTTNATPMKLTAVCVLKRSLIWHKIGCKPQNFVKILYKLDHIWGNIS